MEKSASKSTQLDIDQAILDYLLHTTIKALLNDYKFARSQDDDGLVKQEANSSLYLQMVESFLLMYRSMHPEHHATVEVQFRLHLLRFISMFIARFALVPIKPSSTGLRGMRKDNTQRAQAFGENIGLAGSMDLKVMDPEGRTSGEFSDKHHSPSSLYPTPGKIFLLDTLPLFMALSATQSVLQDRPITDVWMRLAAGFMAHAALEQCLVHDQQLSDAMVEAFAWGFNAESTADEGSEDWQINAMFLGDDEEIAGWTKIRNEHIQALIPPAGTSLKAHAEILLGKELPLDAFEQSLMSFIEGLLDDQPKPLYTQLELGMIDGFSQEESRRLQDKIGLN